MVFKKRYQNAKEKLLSDESICEENRDLWRRFFEYEEHKLKRMNGLPSLDEGCYKTLANYLYKFRNVNSWFGNKSWVDLTKADIQKVYDDLEDGKIRNRHGERFKDNVSYYTKIFKSKPFRMAGKSELAKEVIEYSVPPNVQVRWIMQETFLKLTSVLSKPKHHLLFWLAWDIGENIGAILKLSKLDFTRQINADSGEPEYLVNLPKEKLKRTRKARTEVTLYKETTYFLDMVLGELGDDETIFGFGHAQAAQVMRGVAQKTGARTMPNNEVPRWKDLRSGMACHLLLNGWSMEEINARLGHSLTSNILEKYITALAMDRQAPKKKLDDTRRTRTERRLDESRQREKLYQERLRKSDKEMEYVLSELGRQRNEIRQVRVLIQRLLADSEKAID